MLIKHITQREWPIYQVSNSASILKLRHTVAVLKIEKCHVSAPSDEQKDKMYLLMEGSYGIMAFTLCHGCGQNGV